MKLQELPPLGWARQDFHFLDHFDSYSSGSRWTSVTTGGTVAASATLPGGINVLTATNTQGHEVSMATTATLLKMAAGKDFYLEVGLQFAEANTNTINFAFGLANTFGAGTMGGTTTGPSINSSGALIYKLSGTTNWATYAKNNSVVASTNANEISGGAAQVRLGIKGRQTGAGSGQYELTYFFGTDNGPSKALTIAGDTNYRPIIHRLAYASAVAMKAGVYLQTDSATQEVVNVDWFFLGSKL